MEVHGLRVAAIVETSTVKETAQFENCGADLRYSRCIRPDSVESPVLWGKDARIRFGEAGAKVEEQQTGTAVRR